MAPADLALMTALVEAMLPAAEQRVSSCREGADPSSSRGSCSDPGVGTRMEQTTEHHFDFFE